jgi:hypothetical protein
VWASRFAAGRCPTLTIHSRKIAESISVSRQNASATLGLARVSARTVVWLMKPSVEGINEMRS